MFFRTKWKETTATLAAELSQKAGFLSYKVIDKAKGLFGFIKKVPLLNTLFLPPPSNTMGLDIGVNALRIIKINTQTLPFTIEYAAISPLKEGIVTKDEIKDYAAVGNALKDMLRFSPIKSKLVAVAIPRSLAIIKTITVDHRLSEEDIESRAWIEANRHFPDLIGDIHLDFTITGPAPTDASQLELMLVACRKDQIKPYLEVLKQAGLTAKMVDINCYALERALSLVSEKADTEVMANLNLNVNLSSLVVSQHGHLIHAHDQSYDGKRLLNQAETYIKNKGEADPASLLEDAAYFDILKENLISHLRHSIHFFYSSKPNVSIQTIILSGDCAILPGLAQFIQKELDIPTLVANPFEKMVFAKEVNKEDIQKHASEMMLCCGLALSLDQRG